MSHKLALLLIALFCLASPPELMAEPCTTVVERLACLESSVSTNVTNIGTNVTDIGTNVTNIDDIITLISESALTDLTDLFDQYSDVLTPELKTYIEIAKTTVQFYIAQEIEGIGDFLGGAQPPVVLIQILRIVV